MGRGTFVNYLTRKQVAVLTGLTIETIKTYRRDGIMPEADLYVDRKPLWKESTIIKWRKGK